MEVTGRSYSALLALVFGAAWLVEHCCPSPVPPALSNAQLETDRSAGGTTCLGAADTLVSLRMADGCLMLLCIAALQMLACSLAQCASINPLNRVSTRSPFPSALLVLPRHRLVCFGSRRLRSLNTVLVCTYTVHLGIVITVWETNETLSNL